ncbi:MAG: RNA methyltransferase [bacterium]
MKVITSPDNPCVRRFASLRTHKGREQTGAFLAEGVSLIEDALNSNCRVNTLFVRSDIVENKRIKSLLKKAQSEDVKVIITSERVFKKITSRETPQGVAAEIAKPMLPPLEKVRTRGLLIMAERLQDPRNAGLLLRTSLAAGVNAVFLTTDSVDPFHPAAVQTSMGAILHLPVYTKVNPVDLINTIRTIGGKVYAALPGGAIDMLKWKPPPQPLLLVFGNESGGVSDGVRKNCDSTISIPIFGKIESLNVSVAAGILCYRYRTAQIE